MTRSEIVKLAKYGESCYQDGLNSPDMKDKLLSLAEEQFNYLIGEYKAECIEPMVGYLYSRLGEIKYTQSNYIEAEKNYLDALGNLIVKGEYCQDRARTHVGLARTYMKLHKDKDAREHFIRAVHIYDSLSMSDKIQQLTNDFNNLQIDIKSILPAKQINEKGKPTKCRECGGNEFKRIESDNEKIAIYDCKACGCRNVVILDMLELSQSH